MDVPVSVLLQLAVITVGAAFIVAWRRFAWGPAALMAGIFFISVAVVTILIDLAAVPGFWQPLLTGPVFSFTALGGILVLMIVTVVVGVLQSMGIVRRRRR